MSRVRASLLSLLLLTAPACWGATPAETLKSIRVPEGFTVELVAEAPLVEHPLMAGFDDRGRLYVADNAGLNLKAEELEKQLPNSIRRLEDTDGDGRFDKATTFADKMTFPQGAVWFRGALYVASPPNIWRLVDTDDDGVCDERTPIVGRFGYIGNAADIHGCFLTPTGRIAWCDGRHGHEFKDSAGNTTSKGQAARIFTALPDGSDVETFAGGGMDNPVEIAFTAAGEPLGTMTFYNPDEARHDALVHYVFGGVYPRKHPCTEEFKRTGPLMPAVSKFGVTAPSGLTRYDGASWGEEFQNNLFSAHFNTHKILRHVLARDGATFTSRDEDFLTSDNVDFHPTDVLVDADGSLLVIDTGGWFRIGCPTSQIAKPEIGGAIYRIRKSGSRPIDDPRGLKIDWETTSDTEMADLFADPRPAVVERAIEFLVPRGDAAMGALATALFEPDLGSRQSAMWALARINTENARLLLRQGLSDDDVDGRVAAIKAVGDIRDAEAILPLIDRLTNDEAPVRREAATALGRLKQPAAVPAILKALAKPIDRFEEHALIFALIQIDDRASTMAGLNDENANVRKAALIALDQMSAGNLTRDLIAPLLATDDAPLLDALFDILGRHPDWSGELVAQLGEWIEERNPDERHLATIRGAAGRLIGNQQVAERIRTALVSEQTAKPIRLALLEAVAELEDAKPWEAAIVPNLETADHDVLRQAIASLATTGSGQHSATLLRIGNAPKHPADLRIAALRAAAPAVDSQAVDFLLAQMAESETLADRLAVAETLGRVKLPSVQRQRILPVLAGASPLELPWLLQAFARDSDPRIGRSLLQALEGAQAAASVTGTQVREVFATYPQEVQSAAEAWLAGRTGGDKDSRAALEQFLASAPEGDPARGEAVFFGQRAACAACHRVGQRGEKIGPDLSTIGQVRNRRDLAEAVLFPSASLARGYESMGLVTKSGQVHTGLLERQTATAVHLRTADRAEIRVPRDEIDELVPSTTSIMPQGLNKVLSAAELSDVIAYLESLR